MNHSFCYQNVLLFTLHVLGELLLSRNEYFVLNSAICPQKGIGALFLPFFPHPSTCFPFGTVSPKDIGWGRIMCIVERPGGYYLNQVINVMKR